MESSICTIWKNFSKIRLLSQWKGYFVYKLKKLFSHPLQNGIPFKQIGIVITVLKDKILPRAQSTS
uniref:AlNc14C132G7003 protein n=1 Tax=Albugo laibachii Nc14 TaxID=890382 RepID=F0WKF1_9STRA|nr:AlNc14C132G7003 [Albugo laibachii Nc14]|eukprot:CCA21755.1 AlNc14C132G7003 [Albugo laibachii Nc14]